MLTIGTGFSLVFALGGNVPTPILIGIITAISMMLVGGGFIGRHARIIEAALEEGADPATLLPHAKKMAMGTGIFHTLWLVTLAMMVFRTQF